MEQINKLQTKTYIVNAIKKEILSGNIKAGEELVQESIAQVLGVSRMPVREAFQLLEQEGFLIRLPNRHMQVAEISEDHISSIFRVLAAVEYQIIQELYAYQADMSKVLTLSSTYLQSDGTTHSLQREMEIHKQLSKTLNNDYLTKIHHSMLEGYYSYARALAKKAEAKAAADMKAFLLCLMAGDKAGMKDKLNDYFTGIAKYLIREMKG